MKIKFRHLLIAMALLSGTALFAQNPKDIVHAHAKAIGGKKALKSVQTVKRTATVTLGNGVEIPVTFLQKRPNLSRQEIEFQGTKIVQAYDGQKAWQVNPLTGVTEATEVPEAQADLLIRRAYMDDILWENQKLRKVTLDYKGKVDQDGHSCHHVLVTFGDGFTQDRFYDADSKLLYQIAQKAPDNTGNLIDTVTTFSDWREVGKVKYPYKVENSIGQSVTFTDTKINEPIDDTLFTMPQ